MREFFDLKIVRWFLGSQTAQMISAGVVWALITAWFCFAATAFVTPDSRWWVLIIPAAAGIGLQMITGHSGYLELLEQMRKKLRHRLLETIPPGVRFILKDSVEQVNWENKYPGFGEALHQACIRDFFDDSDVVWVDVEYNKTYSHFRIDKNAICYFKG